jgi:isopropylmalate/homocitrate/citramalate synthase
VRLVDELTKHVTLRDSTLREGQDTPGVSFSTEQKVIIARALEEAGVSEAEIVAPSRVLKDLEAVKKIRDSGLRLSVSGLIYAYSLRLAEETNEASKYLHRFDLLMPVVEQREPFDRQSKIKVLLDALGVALSLQCHAGVGFPHATQTEVGFLLEIAHRAVERGAERLTIYDTNGSAEPFFVYDLIGRIRKEFQVPIFFHGHNDLGLATANALAATRAGANGLDVTANGLGDRAGNAALEQVVLGLHLGGYSTGIAPDRLKPLSELVEKESGIEVSKLAPVVGEFVRHHKSASHLKNPSLFEAYDPSLVGGKRKLDELP